MPVNEANEGIVYLGPAPQPLRGIPGNVFQQQQPPSTARPGSIGSARLQNGKFGSGSGWGISGMAGGPGAQNMQSRTNSAGLSSFAQTIGGQRSNAPLDLSEFPSLSGTPQSQQQNASSQAIWNSSNLRAGPQAPVQRPQTQTQPSSTNPQPIQQPSQTQPQQRNDPQHDSQPSPFPPLSGSMDDYRFEDHGGTGRTSRAPGQQGSGDDFPPLGLGESDVGQSRRAPIGQGSHFNGLGTATGYGDASSQTRSGLLGQIETQRESAAPGHQGTRIVSPTDLNNRASRSPFESREEDQDGFGRQNQPIGSRIAHPSAAEQFSMQQRGQRPIRADTGPDQPSQQQQDGGYQGLPNLAKMTDLERFGLHGLLATLRGESQDQASLALGMDLNNLGLDLQRADHEPIYPTWPGPFADPNARPTIPEFQLPPAYAVHNVPPLASKIGSFSDETLFAIFYQNPRDHAQELAAVELYSRDWRWHKKLQQWMMKAKEFGDPVQLQSMREERGYYYFFNPNNWTRERKEFILNYENLYHGMVGTAGH